MVTSMLGKIAVDATGCRIELDAARRSDAKVLSAGANVERAGLNGFVRFGFFHADAGEFRELRRVLRGERRRHVLHEKNRRRKFARESGSEAHDGRGTASRSAENDDRETLIEGSQRDGRRPRRNSWRRFWT